MQFLVTFMMALLIFLVHPAMIQAVEPVRSAQQLKDDQELIDVLTKERQPKEYLIYGYGEHHCTSYISVFSRHDADYKVQTDLGYFLPMAPVYAQWVSGYITGINMSNPKEQIREDRLTMFEWVRQYCYDYPLIKIESAALAFVEAHRSSSLEE